jgi:integrase
VQAFRSRRRTHRHAKVFSVHSLRAGFVTSVLDAGVDAMKIMPITGHKKVDTLQAYGRRENDFDSHAGEIFCETARRPSPTSPSAVGSKKV